jgi:hypothetical protein
MYGLDGYDKPAIATAVPAPANLAFVNYGFVIARFFGEAKTRRRSGFAAFSAVSYCRMCQTDTSAGSVAAAVIMTIITANRTTYVLIR